MKVIFAGTPEFAVKPLTALLDVHQIVAVFTQPDRPAGRGKKLTESPVKQLALEHKLPIFQPSNLRDQIQVIDLLAADIIVVVAYGMLLPQAILDIPPLGCINIHASILPRWRGAAPIQRAIEAGDAQTGVSIMKMEVGLDTGPVYQVLTTSIDDQDTALSLHDKLSEIGAQAIVTTLDSLQAEPAPTPRPQNDAQANYAHKISKHEAKIDWSLSAQQIQARIRAFYPWPVCQTQHRSKTGQQFRIRLSRATVIQYGDPPPSAGTIVCIQPHGVVVACGEGYIRLEVLQRDGGKPLASKEFCNGFKLQVGDQLVSV